ncbi:MAG: NUDIX hydrolase [Longimonas sp.]|uniref:NUDIX domain-containing protein n=1 Tax=Longimonas sp. TaxID=2039626 RepID=UPI003974CDAC
MSDLTETSISSESVFDGHLLHVRCDEVRLPDGRTAPREWIDHPGAVAVVPLFANGDTMLIQQFRFPPRRTFLEVPAGKFDHNDEPPISVGKRELKEETGLTAETMTDMGLFFPCIGYSNEVIHVYLAEDLTEGDQQLTDGEFVEPVRMPFEEAVTKALDGTLKDMKTITALTRARHAIQARGTKI